MGRGRAGAVVAAAAVVGSLGIGTQATAETSAAPDCPETGVVTIEAVVDGLDALDCDLAGTRLDAGGFGVPVPEAGETVTVSLLTDDGTSPSLELSVADDGLVTAVLETTGTTPLGRTVERLQAGAAPDRVEVVDLSADASAHADDVSAQAVGRCRLTDNNRLSYRWTTPATWRLNVERVPNGVTRTQWTSATRNAVTTIENARNNCGMSVNPTLDLRMPGTTAVDADIDGASNACTARDGRSVIDGGHLTGSVLGLTCAWSSSGRVIEADVRIDRSERRWVTSVSGCRGSRFHVGSTLAHELGHAVGLGHVTERGGSDLTMSPSMPPCNASSASLGRGDVLGLRSHY
ncbi:matrixin family metalloprotease [Georgenia alba]|uniref:Matrixin family metalloprotease n=1 Tax=Georgenia alba TaxID=2233858 RepID=A0ABW2QAG5_9MICO